MPRTPFRHRASLVGRRHPDRRRAARPSSRSIHPRRRRRHRRPQLVRALAARPSRGARDAVEVRESFFRGCLGSVAHPTTEPRPRSDEQRLFRFDRTRARARHAKRGSRGVAKDVGHADDLSSHRRRVALREAALVPVGVGQRAPRWPRRAWRPARASGSSRPRRGSARSCSSLRAPMMTVATVGRCSSQLSAICGTVLPVSSATASSASTTWYRYSSATGGPHVGRLAVQAARRRQRLAAADLAGEPAPAERAPDHRADPLVERQRHQLPLVVAADQRVVGLVGDVARQAVASPTTASDFIRCQPEKFEQPM